jgi:hypothetical protein
MTDAISNQTWAAISEAAERDRIPPEMWLQRMLHYSAYEAERERAERERAERERAEHKTMLTLYVLVALVSCLIFLSSALFWNLHRDDLSVPSAPVGLSTMVTFNDGRESIIGRSFEYRILDTDEHIIIPAGFVTDLASTPRIIWALLPPFGNYQRAAIVHDYLYWTQACTRDQADKAFWLAMFESEVGYVARKIVYEAVRNFGANPWNKNGRERRENLPRFVPKERIPGLVEGPDRASSEDDPLSIRSLDTWDSYRARLRNAGVTLEPPASLTPGFCITAHEKWEENS